VTVGWATLPAALKVVFSVTFTVFRALVSPTRALNTTLPTTFKASLPGLAASTVLLNVIYLTRQ
jgi:hypothetical protein